eukprot:CAMPEP_0172571810 /NCGR_PEP_ID=MMETSP1067-20121228/132649_1 /TAXON_ID=265564 ORGANISM="Thalassiosira punctigera, Strain Tpunct2005C2" /NCGR_SAMPLE_ID=MMETSP1067 /ASSEMBLY_ACC=CAM_ASM_000444 /LENGTH=251 /DNA_ID=CAMNT_0013364221 /DNA_START=111 /DNA_END=863 /DNA_ORIENTATION=-
MTSSKKKRGKQRKARKERHGSVGGYIESLGNLPAGAVIKAIADREEVPTEAAFDFFTGIGYNRQAGTEISEGHKVIYDRLIDAGLVSTLVGIANEGFIQDYQGTNHMIFLSNIAHDNDASRLEIASRIGPAISFMLDDIEPNKWWYESLTGFLNLVLNLASSGENKEEVLHILLEYEGLFKFMVQSMFFGTHRPDVVKGSKKSYPNSSPDKVDHFFQISCAASNFVHLVCEQQDEQSDDRKKNLHGIATVP